MYVEILQYDRILFMTRHISCCGFDCSGCRLYISQEKASGNEALEDGGEKQRCGGCRSEGVKFPYCEECRIRKCVMSRGIVSCMECAMLNSCTEAASLRK